MKSIISLPVFILMTYGLAAQNIVTVTDCNLQGWTRQLQASTSLIFKNEPPAPVLGNGSLEFVTLVSNFGRFRNTNFHNTLLSSLTELSYSCFIQNRENTLDANYLVLQIDKNGDGRTDDRLEFDPRFQTGHYVTGIAPDQGPTIVGVWQTWDALHGGWWIGPAPDPDDGGESFTLATYISRNPTARIVNDAALGGGGIRFSVGAPFPLFAHNYRGYADNFRIGVNGVTTIYDFEFTTADAGPDKTVVLGYGSNCTTLTGHAAGGMAPYAFSWSPGGNTPAGISTEVCPTATTTYTFTVTDANGCSRTDNVTVNVNDVRCGNKLDKVKICHNGEEICVAAAAVPAHLNHGDVLGACSPALITKATNKNEIENSLPGKLNISNYPNPFSGLSTIRYELPFDGKIQIKLYTVAGKEIGVLADSYKSAGMHQLVFNGNRLSKGIYFYTLTADSGNKIFRQTNKMVIY
jgi:hypothetical protein